MAEKGSISFITDENMGPCIATVFRAVGIYCVMHIPKAYQGVPDPDILKHTSMRNAILITCDRSMLNSADIMSAARMYLSRILFLSSKYAQSHPIDKAAWFLKHWKKIETAFDDTDELLLTIEWNGNIHPALAMQQRPHRKQQLETQHQTADIAKHQTIIPA